MGNIKRTTFSTSNTLLSSLSFQRPSTRLCPSHPIWPALSSTVPTRPWQPTVALLSLSCSAASDNTSLGTPIPLWTKVCAASIMTFSLWSTAACSTRGSATRRPGPSPPRPPVTTTAYGWRGRTSTRSDLILASCSAACPGRWGLAERWVNCWDWPRRFWMRPSGRRYPGSVDGVWWGCSTVPTAEGWHWYGPAPDCVSTSWEDVWWVCVSLLWYWLYLCFHYSIGSVNWRRSLTSIMRTQK